MLRRSSTIFRLLAALWQHLVSVWICRNFCCIVSCICDRSFDHFNISPVCQVFYPNLFLFHGHIYEGDAVNSFQEGLKPGFTHVTLDSGRADHRVLQGFYLCGGTKRNACQYQECQERFFHTINLLCDEFNKLLSNLPGRLATLTKCPLLHWK